MFSRLLRWLRGQKTGEAAGTAVSSLVSRAYALLQQGHYAESRRVLLQVLENKDEMQDSTALEWILSCLAWTWDGSEQYRESVEFFSNYIEHHPKESIAYTMRACARWYLGDLPEAAADYSKALKLNPADAQALSGRGQVLVELGENDKAIQDLDAALSYVEHSSVAGPGWKEQIQAFTLNGRGAAHGMRGEYDLAFADFDKSISLCPENAWVYYNRAGTYESRGDMASAFTDYERALSMKSPKLNPLRREFAEAKVKSQVG